MKKTLSVILCILLILPLLPVIEFGTAAETTYTVTMTGYAADSKVSAIKAVREITDLGLTQAKNFVENLPGVLASGVTLARVNQITATLDAANAGITYTVKEDGSSSGTPEIRYRVVVDSYACTKLEAITAVRSATGLGLVESRDLVEAIPCEVLGQASYNKALTVQADLNAAGVRASLCADPLTDDALIGCGAGWYIFDPNYIEAQAVPSFLNSYDPNRYLMIGEYVNGFIYGISNEGHLVISPYADGCLDNFVEPGPVNSEMYDLFNRTMALAYDPIGSDLYAAVRSKSGTDTEIYYVAYSGDDYFYAGTIRGLTVSDFTFDGNGNVYALSDNTFYLLDLENFTAQKLCTANILYGNIISIAADVNTGELFCDYSYYYRDTVEKIAEDDPDFYRHFDSICLVDTSNGGIVTVMYDCPGDILGIRALSSLSTLRSQSTCEWIGGSRMKDQFLMNDAYVAKVDTQLDGEFMDAVFFNGLIYGLGMDPVMGKYSLMCARYENNGTPTVSDVTVLSTFDEGFTLQDISYDPSTNSLVGIDDNNTLYDITPDFYNEYASFTKRAQLSTGSSRIRAIAFCSDGSFAGITGDRLYLFGPYNGGTSYEELISGDVTVPETEYCDVAVDPETDEVFVVTRFDRVDLYSDEAHQYSFVDRIYRVNLPFPTLTFVREVQGDNFPYLNLTAIRSDYPLWVNGIRVTESNCADILGNGSASFDRGTNTLSLSDVIFTDTATVPVRVNGTSHTVNAPIIFADPACTLTVMISGDCIIANNDETARDLFGIWAAGSLDIVSEGATLAIEIGNSDFETGIYADKASIVGGGITITTADSDFETEGIVTERGLSLYNSNINIYTGNADHYAAAILIRSGEYHQTFGTVNAVAGSGGISSYGLEFGEYAYGVLLLAPAGGTFYATGEDAAMNRVPDFTLDDIEITVGKYGATSLSPWDWKTNLTKYGQVKFTVTAYYDLSVCGIRINSENAADVLGDGTVSYDIFTNTLTLKGAALKTYAGIPSGSDAPVAMIDSQLGIVRDTVLRIALEGTNTITVPAAPADCDMYGIRSTCHVILTGDGSLGISMPGSTGSGSCYGISTTGLDIERCKLSVVAGQSEKGDSIGVYVRDGGSLVALDGAYADISSSYTSQTNQELNSGCSYGIIVESGIVAVKYATLIGWSGGSAIPGRSYGIVVVSGTDPDGNRPISFYSGRIVAAGDTANANREIFPYVDIVDIRVNTKAQSGGAKEIYYGEDKLTNYKYVSVSNILWGDVTGDGFVNAKDLTMLRSYLANLDPTTGRSVVAVELGADVNGDGIVNAKDLTMLRSYLANLNPETGISAVVLGPSYK